MPALRTLSLTVVLLSAAAFPGPAEAQLRAGLHGARANDLYAAPAYGVGARIEADFGRFSLMGTMERFFPDCSSCGYDNLAGDVSVTLLPFPFVEIYATGGLAVRLLTEAGTERTGDGYSYGVGVLYPPLRGLFFEVRNEVFDAADGGNQLLFRAGLQLASFPN